MSGYLALGDRVDYRARVMKALRDGRAVTTRGGEVVTVAAHPEVPLALTFRAAAARACYPRHAGLRRRDLVRHPLRQQVDAGSRGAGLDDRDPRHRGRLGRERRHPPERSGQVGPLHRREERRRQPCRPVRPRGRHRVARQQLVLQRPDDRHRARRLRGRRRLPNADVRDEREARPRHSQAKPPSARSAPTASTSIARSSSAIKRCPTATSSRRAIRRAPTRRARACKTTTTAAPATTATPASTGSGATTRTSSARAPRASATTPSTTSTARSTARSWRSAPAGWSRPSTAWVAARSSPSALDDTCNALADGGGGTGGSGAGAGGASPQGEWRRAGRRVGGDPAGTGTGTGTGTGSVRNGWGGERFRQRRRMRNRLVG